MRRRSFTEASPKIARLHLDAVDVQVGNVDVAGPQTLRRQAARIDAGTAVVEFVAASVRQRKPVVALPDAGQFGRQVGQVLRDEMDDDTPYLEAQLGPLLSWSR